MRKYLILILILTLTLTGCTNDGYDHYDMEYNNNEIANINVKVNEYDLGYEKLYEVYFVSEWNEDINMDKVKITLVEEVDYEGLSLETLINDYTTFNYLADINSVLPGFVEKEKLNLDNLNGAFYLYDNFLLNDIGFKIEYEDTVFVIDLNDNNTNKFSKEDMKYQLGNKININNEYELAINNYEFIESEATITLDGYTDVLESSIYIVADVTINPLVENLYITNILGTINEQFGIAQIMKEMDIEGYNKIPSTKITEEINTNIIFSTDLPSDFEINEINDISLEFLQGNTIIQSVKIK